MVDIAALGRKIPRLWRRLPRLPRLRRLPRIKLFPSGLSAIMPKGLYARSLIIIIAPVVLLQSVVAFVFMERHWQTVTGRLSAAVVRDIAAVVDMLETFPETARNEEIIRIANQRLGLNVAILPAEPLPPVGPKPFFTLLDRALSEEITGQIARPFWIDTVGRSNLVEIRIQLEGKVLQVIAPRNQAYASNTHIFILWMVGTSLVLLTIAILFLRNQIRPIVKLADAAERFGKGRPVPEFHPRGAREVRRAALAFQEMRERIERQIGQRTTMLSAVSHDLRTLLTRFRLQVALLGDRPEVEELNRDLDDMQAMLEGYLAFARGDVGEEGEPTDIAALIDEIRADAGDDAARISIRYDGDREVTVRPQNFKRCLANLVNNARRHAGKIIVEAINSGGWLTVNVDDDGAGIPPEQRGSVFRPFFRLDDARNLDEQGTGLGLAIARDIARAHGGEIKLGTSPLGGLRATVTIPT